MGARIGLLARTPRPRRAGIEAGRGRGKKGKRGKRFGKGERGGNSVASAYNL